MTLKDWDAGRLDPDWFMGRNSVSKDFVIEKISWHTTVKGNPESREQIYERTWAIAKFVQDHGLATRCLASNISELDDDFEIKRSDVTDEGFEFLRATYDRWLRRIDRGGSPSDVSTLDRALRKLRSK